VPAALRPTNQAQLPSRHRRSLACLLAANGIFTLSSLFVNIAVDVSEDANIRIKSAGVEMRETPKIVSLATALAALGAPAAASPIADAADSDGAHIATEAEEGVQEEAEISLPGDVELMSFTVHRASDGMLFPQHQSHSSHASHSSHSSHVSHASSSPGYGGPYVPNPIYTPPVVAPPVVAPPVVPPTSPPPAPASDPAYLWWHCCF
jgi:hypothetical protein